MSRLHATPVAPAVAVLALVVVPLAAGCVSNAPAGGGAGTIDVESTATECRLSAGTAHAGTITFQVKNTGDEVTEFYLLGEDGVRVVGEVENIGPGLTRDLVVQAGPGRTHGLQAGHGRRRDPAPVHRHGCAGLCVARRGARRAAWPTRGGPASVPRCSAEPARRRLAVGRSASAGQPSLGLLPSGV